MVVFELLLVGMVFITVIGLIAIIASAGTKNFLILKQIASILGIGWGVYLAVLFAVAVLTPQRIYATNQDECLDDLCFAVTNVVHNGSQYSITVRESNHSRGREERELGLRARLWDGKRYYEPAKAGDFAQSLKSGGSTTTEVVFDIPAQAQPPGLVLDHGLTPGYFVIGESPFLHKPPIIRLN